MLRTLPQTDPHSPAPVLANQTIALWRCDEAAAADNFVDASGNSKTLTQANTPTVAASLFNSHPTSGARTFNGTSEYASRATDSDETALQDRYTIAAWIRMANGYAGVGMIATYGAFGETSATNIQAGLRVNASLELEAVWEHSGGTDVITSSGYVLEDDTVYHVGYVMEDEPGAFGKKRVRFYVDGVRVATEGGLEAPTGGGSSFWSVGAAFAASGDAGVTPGEFWEGEIDDVAVYSFAASDEFMRDLYARGIKDWKLDLSGGLNTPGGLGLYEVHTRVLIEDRFGAVDISAGGSEAGRLVDMHSFHGLDWVLEASIDDRGDALASTASVSLVTRHGEMNLSSEMLPQDDFGLNYYSNPVNWNTQFLVENARVKIEAAVVPCGFGRAGADPFWMLMFDGFITSIDAGADETKIECSDRMDPLIDTWIEPDEDGEDREYGSGAGVDIEDIVSSVIDDNRPEAFTVLSVDNDGTGGRTKVVLASGAPGVGQGKPHLFKEGDEVKLSGTTNFNVESQVHEADSESVTLEEIEGGTPAAETTGTLDGLVSTHGYIGGVPELATPSGDVGFAMFPFRVPATQSVAAAIEEMAAGVGYQPRFRWDDERKEFRLYLFRSSSAEDVGAFGLGRVLSASGFSRSKMDERNVIVVEFSDDGNEGTYSDAERKRSVVYATKPDQNAIYRRRYARVGNASNSLVNTESEAQAQATNIADDLENPQGQGEIEQVFHPSMESGSFTTLNATGYPDLEFVPVIVAEDTDLGIIDVRHRFTRKGSRTRISTRKGDTPPTKTTKYTDIFQARGAVPGLGTKPPPPISIDDVATTPFNYEISDIARNRGFHADVSYLTLPDNINSKMWDMLELHVKVNVDDTFSNPSKTTLVDASRGKNLVARGLTAGTEYVYVVGIRDRAGNISFSDPEVIEIPAD